MAVAFNEQAFEQKLCNLKDTQESINAMSTWCLKNKEHHKKIVICWLHCLKRVKIDQRLSLFYLANDVIQYSKRKHLDFVNSWGTALQKATTLVRDDKVRNRIMRIFKIWEERGVYDEPFITDLCGLLTTHVKKKEPEITDPAEFQPTALFKKVRECCLLEENTDTRYRRVKDFNLPLTNADSMRQSLKDRRHGSDVQAEVDSGVRKMEAYVKALETEISSREKLIDILRQAMLFYETQRGEAKVVANAYKNFGGRLRARQKTLEELVPTLLSPLPSPDVNAPSPSPDPDLEGGHPVAPPPTFNGGELDFSFSSSFIGSQFLDLHKDVFSNEPPPPIQEAPQYEGPQSIQVIGARPDGDQSFNVAEFLKSLMPTKETVLQPPPMPPAVFGDWSGVPWEVPPPETPASPPAYEKQVTHVQPIEYDDSIPVPPIPDVDHRLLSMHNEVVMPPLERLPPMSCIDTDQRLPSVALDTPPPPLGVDIHHRLHPPMEYPPAMVMDRMDVPPPNTVEHHGLMDHPPPLLLKPPPNPPDLMGLTVEPPSPELNHLRMSMEPPLSTSKLNLMSMDPERNHLRNHMDPNPQSLEHLRMEPPPILPDLDHIVSVERGAILAGPPSADMDRRMLGKTDIPRRNLISLTGSPRVASNDNVESVDMDVSDDDEFQARAFGDGGERRFGGAASRRGNGPSRFLNNVNSRYSAAEEEPATDEPEQSMGAKLIPPADISNGMPRPRFAGDFRGRGIDYTPRPRGEFPAREEFSPRPRWRSPRPNTPYRTSSPFRGNFRPRGRW